MDIMHVYEHSKKLTLMEPVTHKLTQDYDKFNTAVDSLIENAKKDLAGEGLDSANATFVLELDMLYGGQFHVKRTLSPLRFIKTESDVKAICDAFEKEFSEAFSPFVVNPDGGVFVDSFVLKAIVPTKKVSLPKMTLEKPKPDAALKGARAVYWTDKKDFCTTDIYDFEKLRPGNIIQGPAVVESDYTTLVVPFPLRFSIDVSAGFTAQQAVSMLAADAGFRFLKFFPASAAGGVAMLKAWAGPFADVVFCPTGGIGAASAPDYLALAIVKVVGGSWLTPADALAAADWLRIERLAREAANLGA